MHHHLYSDALQADENYSNVITAHFPGKTRWTLTKEQSEHPEVKTAYDAKQKADDAWLAHMREQNSK